jgi:hypothetical protein
VLWLSYFPGLELKVYPPKTISIRVNQIKLWDAIDLDDGYSHFWDASIDNLCFFFKDPKNSFFPANTSSKLNNLGPFSHERWIHVHEIYCLFLNIEQGQAGEICSDNTSKVC